MTNTALFASEITAAEILTAYNNFAAIIGEPAVKRFSDRKTAIRRLEAIQARVEATKPVAPKADPVPAKKAKAPKAAPAVLDAIATGADGWTLKIGFAGSDRKAAIRAIRDEVKARGESGKHGVIRFKAVKA